jgi:hypothetical protein
MGDDSPRLNRQLEIHVDAPLTVRLMHSGCIDVESYQQILGEVETVTMCVRFSPYAVKALANAFKMMLDKGLLPTEEPAPRAFTH